MKIKNYILVLIVLFSIFSCVEKDIEGGDLFSQKAVLYLKKNTTGKKAKLSERNAIVASDEDEGLQKSVDFFVNLVKENTNEVNVKLALSEEDVKKYNDKYGTSYPVFPKEHIKYTPSLKIEAGKVNSELGHLEVEISPDLKDNTTYMFALKLASASNGVEVLESSSTLLFTVEKTSGLIKKTAILSRDTYFAIEGVNSIAGIGNTFTMEGLVYVDKFRGPGDAGEAGITTFMGTEGGALMRFGDAGVEPNHLQANGTDIGVTFKTKRWYHIAMVVANGETVMYVNGKKVISFPAARQLGEFFIGRSWSDHRGLPGKVSEIRLWNVARSATEIAENMYSVSPKTSGLYAYWKMNEVKNNKIEDASGNDRNLVLLGQANLSGRQDVKLSTEENPVSVE